MPKRIIEAWHYHHGLSIGEISSRFGLLPLIVSNYLEYGFPEEPPLDLPHVGPPNDRLYSQGICLGCKIGLFGGQKIKRDYCGECDPRGRPI